LALLLLLPTAGRADDDAAFAAGPTTEPATLVKGGGLQLISKDDQTKKDGKTKKTPAAEKTLPWLSSLAEGQRRAAADRKPLLVRVGAVWCGPCHKLDAQIEMPSVQAELARWTLVYLDADKSEEEVADLNVTALPSLRVRTMLGEAVAAQEGLLSAEDLVSWLKKQYEAAAAEADEVLLSSDEPDAAAVVRLVKQFHERSPAIREAAMRRLAPYPQKARLEVARAFAEGGLAQRLAALELLRQWKAPVEELDPWQPQSLTAERIAALKLWAEKYQPPAAPEVKKLTEQALVEARRDIDRMLKAGPADAEAIRHRLAGYGTELLPEVTLRLKETAGDEQRQRLWALRYRLVAADSLALRWPGGLERLAAADPRPRQQAADELARLASAADQPLLVELFSDNDPLVREFSLRGLQNVGGKETTAALVKLLADPEPNVRAAVLKQLEEKPDASIVPKLAEYLKTEKDADLLVHAIRFLKAAGGDAATRALVPLLRHESWQVRAEACEALGKTRGSRSYSYVNGVRVEDGDDLQVEVYAAMLELLDDADAFVVSRAVEGLANADMALAVDPLARAAVKHPDLATKIVQMLAQGEKMRVAAVPHLRKFSKDADPQVRAAALEGLSVALPAEMGGEIAAGLQDPSEKVRIAAAGVCFKGMEAQRSRRLQELQQRNSGNVTFEVEEAAAAAPASGSSSLLGGVLDLLTKSGSPAKPAETKPAEIKPAESKPAESKPGAESNVVEETPYDIWLKEYYGGKRRPAWAADLVPLLEKMLTAKDVDERLAAALALVPLGQAQTALPKLYEMARSDANKYAEVMEVLPWLVWEQRLEAFRQLRKIAPEGSALSTLVGSMAEVHDPRAADLFWDVLADPKTTLRQTPNIEYSLLGVYGIEYYSSRRNEPVGPQMKRSLQRLAESAQARVATGSDVQRLFALALLTYADPDKAMEVAEKLQADQGLSADLRRDAFQVLLALSPKQKGDRAAAAALSGNDAARQKLALSYFVRGPEALRLVLNEITVQLGWEDDNVRRSGVPIVPKPPEGLQVSRLLPLLDNSDAAVAAEAGYLLALMGESRGLGPLLRYAEQQGTNDWQTQRLAYRAIAALDDSNQVPVLKKIYAALQQQRFQMSEFYWTIRIMTGPEILAFRKQIRDEVGMDQLQ
jgi:thioredoxin-like negative regulator of GroEL/HEAT repeat protein